MLARQSTAATFLLGPIFDADGVAKTDEVVGSIKVTKNGSVGAPNAGSTLTHNHAGMYLYAANAGDFDTLGAVTFSLNSGTNAMNPRTFQVVPAPVYDALVLGTDILQADLRAILDTALPAESVAGRDAAALGKLLDVATPVLTAASVNQTGDSFARIGANGSGLTSLAQANVWTAALAKILCAFASGKVVIDGANWKFYDTDGITLLFTLTISASGRTVA